MADELAERALEEIRTPLVFYLAELGHLMQALTPEFRGTFELTAQNKAADFKRSSARSRAKIRGFVA